MNKVFATLDPHRRDGALDLSFGNLVVTTNKVCDFHRSVFGSIALPLGLAKFECYFFSTSRPAAGLTNLCSVGIAEQDCALNKYVGEEVSADTAAAPKSYGLITAGGTTTSGPGIHGGGHNLVPLQAIEERVCIGVFFRGDASAPYVAWQANGNFLGQIALPPGKIWVPAVSIGSSASPDDVSAYLNFGQRGLDFPLSTLSL